VDSSPRTAQESPVRPLSRWLRAAAPIAALILFVSFVLHPFILQGKVLYWGDIALYFEPQAELIRAFLRDGRLPLWNDYVLCGQPLAANPQSSAFYPGTMLLTLLPAWTYLTWISAAHVLGAGVGAYLYLRRIAGDRLAALLGAMTFCGSGFLIARLQFPTMTQASAYLPWILFLVDRTVERPGPGWAGLLAVCVALALLAGHPQITYMTLACATVYAAVRLWQARRHPQRRRRALAGLTGALLLGLCAAAVQLLPTLQLFALSTRESLTWSESNRFVLLPEQLLGLVLPQFFGSPATADFWPKGNAWEPSIHVGAVPLALAVFAALRGARRPAVRFYLLVAGVALLLAMGRHGGLYLAAYYLVPGISSFHDPARFAFLSTFALAVLAAIGMRRLRERGASPRIRLLVAASAALSLWWPAAGFNPAMDPAYLNSRPANADRLPREGAGRVYSAKRSDVWERFVSYMDYGPAAPAYARALFATLTPNLGARWGIEEAGGYEPVPLRPVTQIDAAVRTALERHAPNLPALLGLLNATVLALPQGQRLAHPGFLAGAPGTGASLHPVRDPLPRAWLVRRVRRADESTRSLAAVTDPLFDPRTEAVASGWHGGDWPIDATMNGAVRGPLTGADGRSLEFRVEAGPAPALLVWSAAWHPGWTATVNGAPAAVLRANHAFRGIPVPAGTSRVVARFQPGDLRLGLYLSAASAGAIACALTLGAMDQARRRAQRNRAPTAE